jgi:hypothetical protein
MGEQLLEDVSYDKSPVDGAEDGGGEAERRRLKSFLLFLQILCIAMARMD